MSLHVGHPGVSKAHEDHLDAQDRLDEVVGQAKATPIAAPVLPTVQQTHEMRVRMGDPAASTVLGGNGAGGMLDVVSSSKALERAGIDLRAFQNHLTAVAISGFNPDRQQELIAYLLRREAAQPDRSLAPETWAFVAHAVRAASGLRQHSIEPLRALLNARGVRLYPSDRIPAAKLAEHTLDRRTFLDTLARCEKAGGSIDRRTAKQLMLGVRHSVDSSDLFDAQWQVRRRLLEGKLRFEQPEDEERFFAVLAEKLEGAVSEKELSYTIAKLRDAGFADLDRLRHLVVNSKANPRVLFHAERLFQTNMEQAMNRATKQARTVERRIRFLDQDIDRKRKVGAPTDALVAERTALAQSLPELRAQAAGEVARLGSIEENFAEFMAPLVDGKFDAWGLRTQTLRRYRRGEITRAEAAGLLSAIAVSSTPAEFAAARAHMYYQLCVLQGFADLQAAWSDMMQQMARNLTDDTYDAHGNIIESAAQKAMKRFLRQLREQEMQLRSETSRRARAHLEGNRELVHELRERAQVRGSVSELDSALSQATSPAQAEALQGRRTALHSEGADIDRAQKSR